MGPVLLALLWALLQPASAAAPEDNFPESTEKLTTREAMACVDETLLMACYSHQELVTLEALLFEERFTEDSEPCVVPRHYRGYHKGNMLHHIASKCSGQHRCDFNLWDDVPEAKEDTQYWTGCTMVVKYACVNSTSTRDMQHPKTAPSFVDWCGGSSWAQQGWLRSPDYPKTYPGAAACVGDCVQTNVAIPCAQRIEVDHKQIVALTVTDLDLRGNDSLTIRDGNTKEQLAKIEGHLDRVFSFRSSKNSVVLILNSSKPLELVPGRGFMVHYEAIGCPDMKIDRGSTWVAWQNMSHARVECRKGYALINASDANQGGFKHTTVQCDEKKIWPEVDCQDLTVLLSDKTISQSTYDRLYNDTTFEHHRLFLQNQEDHRHFMDLLIPSLVIGFLMVGNVGVVIVILVCRRHGARKSAGEKWENIKCGQEPRLMDELLEAASV